jgi:hypothetical protein
MQVKEPSRLHFRAIQNCEYGLNDFTKSELDGLILVNNMILSQQGYLSKDSIDIAIKLSILFGSYETTEVDKNIFKAYDKLMRYLHTLNVLYVRVHNVHYASRRCVIYIRSTYFICVCTMCIMLHAEAKHN